MTKLLIPILLIVIVALIAFVIFQSGSLNPAMLVSPSPTASFTPSPSPETVIIKREIVAGGVLNFNRYSIQIPSDWTQTHENTIPEYEKTILTRGSTTISIMQGATGGALCLYGSEPAPEGPSSRFQYFVNLLTQTNQELRRGGENDKAQSFTVCEKQQGSFQQPTSFGHISITNAQQEIISEVDEILRSLKKL